MPDEFKIPIEIKKRRAREEEIVVLEKKETPTVFDRDKILAMIVGNYVKNLGKRTEKFVKKVAEMVSAGEKVESHLLRLPETAFQNQLLRLAYQGVFPIDWLDKVRSKIITETQEKFKQESNLEELSKSEARKVSESTDRVLTGVKAVYNAVLDRKKFAREYGPRYESFVGTNDYIDAVHQTDLVQIIYEKDKPENIKDVFLIQVKNKEMSDQELKKIHQAHQNFLESMPEAARLIVRKELIKKFEKETAEGKIMAWRSKYNELGFNFAAETDITEINAAYITYLIEKTKIPLDFTSFILIMQDEEIANKFFSYFEARSEEFLGKVKNLVVFAKTYETKEEKIIELYNKTRPASLLKTEKFKSVVIHGKEKSEQVLTS